ncbi:MAG: PD-(D/E)XK nuclease family protein, partial [bacterium]|nr:PD-(D/E)XK nuclease family protein [bacterium]
LLQGVIDCCFLTGDGWVLLDYKTDRLRAGVPLEAMAAEHLPQLELYAEALYRLTGLPVAERYVVLISAGRAVRV